MIKFLIENMNNFLLNTILFIFLFLGIQNSNNKQKVFFLRYESVPIPVSFIVGTSFICGSLYSSILISLISKKD